MHLQASRPKTEWKKWLLFPKAMTPEVLWIVVSKTHFGFVSDIRFALTVPLAVSLPWARRRSRS
jgi:hypothetical protein